MKIANTLSGVTEINNISIDLDGIGGSVTATITTDRRLQLNAAANYENRFADDTSGVLAALGLNKFYTGSDSSNIGVNLLVANDHRLFATSQGGGGPSDGRNAVELARVISTIDELFTVLSSL